MFKKIEKIQRACPVCGKMHTLIGYYHKHVWLDGQPKLPMMKLLARYAMCEHCGCVYHDDVSPSEHINDVLIFCTYMQICILLTYTDALIGCMKHYNTSTNCAVATISVIQPIF